MSLESLLQRNRFRAAAGGPIVRPATWGRCAREPFRLGPRRPGAGKPLTNWVLRQHDQWKRSLDRLEEHLRSAQRRNPSQEPKPDRKE